MISHCLRIFGRSRWREFTVRSGDYRGVGWSGGSAYFEFKCKSIGTSAKMMNIEFLFSTLNICILIYTHIRQFVVTFQPVARVRS